MKRSIDQFAFKTEISRSHLNYMQFTNNAVKSPHLVFNKNIIESIILAFDSYIYSSMTGSLYFYVIVMVKCDNLYITAIN